MSEETSSQDIHIDTLFIHDIGTLVLKIDAFTFSKSTTVVMGKIDKIQIKKNSVGHNLENLAILDSTLETPFPMSFSLEQPFKKLYLEKVRLTRVNTQGLMKTLFNFKTKLSKLDVRSCNLGYLNYSLLQGESFIVNITGNEMVVDNENAIDITGDKIIFRDNLVNSKEHGAIRFKSSTSFELVNNKIQNKEQNDSLDVLHLEFGPEILKKIVLKKTSLGRLRSSFLNVNVEHIEISDCSMKLDNEKIFNISAKNVLIKGNNITAVVTEAIHIKVEKHADIIDNYFEHLQRESFYYIGPSSNNTTIRLSHNTFKDFEDGFLKMNSVLLGDQEGPSVEFENLEMKKSCDCTLAHSIICPDDSDIPQRGGRSLNNYHQHQEQMADFENLMDQSIFCYFGRELTRLIDYKNQTDCDSSAVLGAGRTVSPGMPWLVWVGIVVGILCLVVIAVMMAMHVKMIEKRITRRAVDRFIVPASLSREGPVDPLEQAGYWEPGSLPDLLAAIPHSRYVFALQKLVEGLFVLA